jgi:hypothetical protein
MLHLDVEVLRGQLDRCARKSLISHIILTTWHIQVLSNYLVKKGPGFVTGRNILELGSGTGLVGLVAGKLGGNVWITDQAFVSFQFLRARMSTTHRNARPPFPLLCIARFSTSCTGTCYRMVWSQRLWYLSSIGLLLLPLPAIKWFCPLYG